MYLKLYLKHSNAHTESINDVFQLTVAAECLDHLGTDFRFCLSDDSFIQSMTCSMRPL